MIPSDVWEDELTAVAAASGVPRSDLESAVAPDQPPAPPSETHDEDGRLAESASRLLTSAAGAFARAAAGGDLADGLSVLLLVAELFDAPPLRAWTSRLAAADDRSARAADAAQVVAEAAARVHEAHDVAVLRQMEWPWPEARLRQEPPAAPPPEEEPAVPEAVAVEAEETTAPEQAPEQVEAEAEAVRITEAEPEPAAEPAAQAPAPAAPQEPTAPAAPAPQARARLRALVLDRSGIAAGFLARLLEQKGLEAIVASDPRGVAGPPSSSAFDCIFLDADLPGWGAETLLVLRPEWRDRAVLLGMDPARPRHGVLAGLPYLIKPPAEEEIESALATLARRRAQRAQAAAGDA